MLIKVKTLTGKEIELDIEPTDRVDRIKEKVICLGSFFGTCLKALFFILKIWCLINLFDFLLFSETSEEIVTVITGHIN